MKKRTQACLFLVLLLVIASSCSKPRSKPPPSSPPAPPAWRFEKNAILFRMHADPRLNLYEGNAHTLVVCIYQFADPNAFNQLKEEAEGVPKLLECRRFDASVTQAKRLVAEPGQEWTETLDRAEGTKYVGIVAGYFSLQEDKVMRLIEIPLVEEKTPAGTALKPAKLQADVYLGYQNIQVLRGKR